MAIAAGAQQAAVQGSSFTFADISSVAHVSWSICLQSLLVYSVLQCDVVVAVMLRLLLSMPGSV
jgi:hypothetical protein